MIFMIRLKIKIIMKATQMFRGKKITMRIYLRARMTLKGKVIC